MKDIVIFHLAKYWPPRTQKPSDMAHPETLYERIRKGQKTSEWRDASPYWFRRLLFGGNSLYENLTLSKPQGLTPGLKVHTAWFVQGYPKGNVPRLEAEITHLILHLGKQLEIQFKRTREIRVDGVECFWR